MNQAGIAQLIQECANMLNVPIEFHEDPNGWTSIKIDVPGRKRPYSFFIYNDGSRFHIAVNTQIGAVVPHNHRLNSTPHRRLENANSIRWDLRFPDDTKVNDLRPMITDVLRGCAPYKP